MKLGYIGLGKMGSGMAQHLLERGHSVLVLDNNRDVAQKLAWEGAEVAGSLADMGLVLHAPRLIWLMVPHTAVDDVLEELRIYTNKGDVIVDGGNSFYKDSIRRAKQLEEHGVDFLDVGVSGGPEGARSGACLMVGGKKEIFEKYENIFQDIAAPDAYGYMGKSGAGHFVKMVHNGIEYGMMQAIAEGFSIMQRSEFSLDLTRIADVYNHRSVIESRLVGWLKNAYEKYGQDLENISGSAAESGEGKWTVEVAKELGVPVPIIEGAVTFRRESQKTPNYAGRVISALRNQFGGHEVKG